MKKLLILMLFALPVMAAQDVIICDMPDQRTDGTSLPLSDIDKIVWVVDGTEAERTDICEFTLKGNDGNYSVQAFTLDTGGRVSVLTDPKSFTLVTANPSAPRNIRRKGNE